MVGSTVDTCSCVSPTEPFGSISYIFYVKVDSELEVHSRFALPSRALAGVSEAPDNFGNPSSTS